MQLNITTDYAIRIILALANRDGEVVSSKDISMTMKIPQKYVLKITRSLVDRTSFGCIWWFFIG